MRVYYHSSGTAFTIPSGQVLALAELARGLLHALVLGALLGGGRRRRWFWIAPAFAALNAWLPLVQHTDWPYYLRAANIVEITCDAAVYGGVIVLLLGGRAPPPVGAYSLWSRWPPSAGVGDASRGRSTLAGMEAAVAARRRWWRSRSMWDWLGVVTATVLVVLGSLGESYPTNPADMLPPGATAPPWPAYLIVTAAGIALAWRRRWPIGVWAFTVVAVSVYSMLGYVYGAALIAPTIALYEAVSQGRARRAVVLGTVSIVVLMLVGGVLGPFSPLGGPVNVVPFEMLVAVGMGLATANRRKYVAEIQDRAERAERTRDEEARRRVDTERLRIARELHDVVAHTMATINVQAAAAAHVLVDPPVEAAEAIAAIRTASKEGLRELRTILNVLRQADDQDSVQPTPGLGQLDVLVGTMRRAGLATEVRIIGELPPLPPAVDVAAYRIIQESLTNVLRHAGPATATVELAVRDGQLCVHVGDTGAGVAHRPGGEPTGHGLIGMGERAASVGGTMDAGPAPNGGFHVRATLPVEVRQMVAP